jgi:hypothetical protein
MRNERSSWRMSSPPGAGRYGGCGAWSAPEREKGSMMTTITETGFDSG